MDKDRIAGIGKALKGNIKEAAGKVTGDQQLETDGKVGQGGGQDSERGRGIEGRGARRPQGPLTGPSRAPRGLRRGVFFCAAASRPAVAVILRNPSNRQG